MYITPSEDEDEDLEEGSEDGEEEQTEERQAGEQEKGQEESSTGETTEDTVDETGKPFNYKWSGKVYGKDLEQDFTQDSLNVAIQKGLAADAVMKQGASDKAQLKQFVDQVKANPKQFLTQIGVDPDEWADNQVAKRVEREMMTDEEKLHARIAELEQQGVTREEEKKADARTAAQHKQQAEVDQYVQYFDNLFSQALKSSNLPKHPVVINQISAYYEAEADTLRNDAVSQGLDQVPEVDLDKVIKKVEKDWGDYITQRLGGDISAEEVIKIIGDDNANKIRKYYVDTAHEKSVPSINSPRVGKRGGAKSKKVSKEDFLADNPGFFGGHEVL